MLQPELHLQGGRLDGFDEAAGLGEIEREFERLCEQYDAVEALVASVISAFRDVCHRSCKVTVIVDT